MDELPLKQQDAFELLLSVSGDFKICSSELLNIWPDKKGFSLMQGE